MDLNEYILSKVENHMLLKDALLDIAELMGHTATSPISANIFCLDLDFTLEEHDKIMGCLSRLAPKKTLSLATVKTEITRVVPATTELSAKVFNGMLKIFLKQYEIELTIPELT